MTQIVLAVLVVMAIVIAVDTVQIRRRRLLDAVDVSAMVDARIADAPGGLDLWASIETALGSTSAAVAKQTADVWKDLEERIDPRLFRPRIATGTEWKLFRLRWGNDYGVVANSPHDLYFRLEPWEIELFPLMDGTRTVGDIIVERFEADGDLDAGGVVALVKSLHEGGFLDPRPVDVSSSVVGKLDPASAVRRKLRHFAKTLRIEWSGADRFVSSLYRHGLRFVFRPVVAAAALTLAVGGFLAFISVELSGRFTLDAASAPAESILLIAMGLFLTFAHELGHAVVETHNGRHIGSAGFFIYFGSPAFFVDASDSLLMDRPQRMLQSAAGPLFELVLAGIAGLVLFFFPDWGAAGFLYRFALLNFFVIFLNLIPLLELDGYWIFSDLIQVPDLRPRSLAFIQHDLWHKLRVRDRFTAQEWGLGLYGLIGIAFTIVSLFSAFFFWKEVFGGLVFGLWDGGPASRVLLVFVGFFLCGPLIRGVFTLVRTLWRRVLSISRRLRFKVETRWRVEAAELIDALPAFEDLPPELLSDLAGRVKLRTVRQGQPVFRQGERATAFYVVRTGVIHIETEHPDTGDTEVLTMLERGDSFGELALLQTTPRSATARAATETELFEVDEATFDRLLADQITAPTFGLTLQAMAEIRELSAFSHLSSDALGELLQHGAWVTAAPGEVLVRQGEEGDAFYAIRAGQVDVVRDDEVIATLGPGDYFGEAALLTSNPRNATVQAHTPVRTFRLSRQGFDDVIAGAFRRGALRLAADRTWEH
jgi:CRP-like cAMP-binding protein/Zn-dependent protease